MKKAKKLIILCCVLAAGCIAVFAATKIQEHQEDIKNEQETILEIPTDSVTALSWEFYDSSDTSDTSDTSEAYSTTDTSTASEVTEGSLSFTKNDDTWNWDDDDTFPVDADKINQLLSWFSELKSDFIIDNVEDLQQYGLVKPTCTINITAGDTSYEIKLGTVSTMDQERYLSIGDDKVYMVSEDPFTDYKTTIEELIKNDTVPTLSIVDDVTVKGVDDYSFKFDAENDNSYCADDEYFTSDDKPLDTTLVSSYFATLQNLTLSDYATYNASTEDLSQYGLDDPELTLTVNYRTQSEEDEDEYTDGTLTMYISRNADEVKAYEEKVAEEAAAAEEADESATDTYETSSSSTSETEDSDMPQAYLRLGDSEIIYNISSSTYDALTAVKYNDLRHQNVIYASFDTIDQIDATIDGKTYEFTVERDDDGNATWYYNDEKVDFTSIQAACEALTADSFTDETPVAKEEISLALHLSNEKFPVVNVTIYQYDGEHCLVQTDSENTCLVSRSSAVSLIEAVNAIVLGNSEQ